ncbi:TonB-dependent receptor [Persicobacter psychrovividus]|uniref:SusC/RagA family TonB-linked outer membrane protein n=1 Tax=Persicobacter psychrovividus TaxID=387638 RepID=A0ABM7VLP8_9BACT|nr:SusC/RagA family TonB-linked outer membrane protein [Persicobacter psychrovividus]
MNLNIFYKWESRGLLLLLLMVVSHWSLAQRQISGVVQMEDGFTIPGVNITLKSQPTIGTVTDLQGTFSIQAGKEDYLVFSFIGYQSQEVKVGNQSKIQVTMFPDVKELDAVVVIGYGEQKERDITGSIGMVKPEALTKIPTANAAQAMQGRMAGVQVSNSTEPGGGTKVRIRGVGTVSGQSDPLYVIDGVLSTSMISVDPNDIESLTVLKDAASAAIYGNRGANGVVIIKTKSGVKGDAKFSFSGEYGVQTPMNLYEMMDTEQYKAYADELFVANGTVRQNRWVRNDDLTHTTNWSEEMFNPAAIQRYNFSAAGGGESGNYRVSMGYTDQQGMLLETGYQRYNLSVKSSMKKGRFRLGETVLFNFSNTKRRPEQSNPGAAIETAPQIPVYDPLNTKSHGYGVPNEDITGTVNTANPVYIHEKKVREAQTFGTNVSLWAEVDIVNGLTFKSNLNGSFSSNFQETKNPAMDQGTALYATLLSRYNENHSWYRGIFWDNYLTYKKTFAEKHDLVLTAGGVIQNENTAYTFHTADGNRDGLETIIGGVKQTYGADKFTKRMLSSFGRFIYTYDGKYTINGSLRADASSQFTKENRLGYFPSISAGWTISEEAFMASNDKIDNLKVRVGYGEVGRDLSLSDRYVAAMYPNVNYPWEGGAANPNTSGHITASLPAQDLRWETSEQLNLGIDVGMFKNRLRLSGEVFQKTSRDMILSVQQMGDLGTGIDADKDFLGVGLKNIGSIQNQGVELSLNYDNFEGELTYSIGGNFTYISNQATELVKVGGKDTPIMEGNQRLEVGESMWYFFGYKTDGLYQQDQGSEDLEPLAKAGDVRYVDTDNSGNITDADRVNLGNSLPKYFYGMNFNMGYKGFDLSVLLEGKAGFKVFNQNAYQLTNTTLKNNRLAELVGNTWSEENTNAEYPAIFASTASQNFSDRHLQNGAYLNIQNVQLGYNLKSLIRTSLITKMRVYVSVNNAYIFTAYDGYNPDVWDTGSSAGASVEYRNNALPTPRIFMAGVQMNF